MAEGQHVDRTTIEFAGRLDQSLNGASNAAVSALGRVQAASGKATLALSAGFARTELAIGRSVRGMGVKIAGMASALGAAFVGFSSIGGFINEALEAASEEKIGLTTRRLTTALQQNEMIAKRGTKAVQEQVRAISETADKMEKYSGTSEAIFRNAFVTLAVHKATSKEIEVISSGMADYLALTKGTAASMEDANALAQKIVAAVSTHKLGRFARELGLTPDQVKNYAKLTSNFERLIFLQKAFENIAKGQATAQVGSLAGRLLLAENEKKRILAQYGEVFKGIKLKWAIASNEMMKTALPFAKPVVDEIGRSFDAVAATVQKMWSNLSSPEMAGFWKDWKTDLADFILFVKPLSDEIKNAFTAEALAKSWKEFISMLQADMKTIETVVGWIQKIGKAFDDSTKAVEDFGKAFRNSINLTEPGKVPHSNLGRGEWDARKAFPGTEQKPSGPSLWQIPWGYGQAPETNKAAETNVPYEHWAARMEAKVAQLNSRAVKDNTEAQTKLNPVLEALKRGNEAVEESLRTLNDAAIAAAMSLKGMFPSGSIGGNYGLHGAMSDVPGAVYEEYPWEGRSSRVGPQGQDLSKPGEVGLGPALMAQKGLRQGDYVTFPGHPELGSRQIRESSARPHGVEFYSTHPGEFTNKYPRLDVEKSKPTSSIQYSPTIHVHGHADKAAIANIHSLLEDHSQDLLRRLRAADMEDYRTSFA